MALRITSHQRVIAILALAAMIFGLGYTKAQMHDRWVAEKSANASVAEMLMEDTQAASAVSWQSD